MNWTKRLTVAAGAAVAVASLAVGPASAAGFDTPGGQRVIVPSSACAVVLTAITFGSPLTPVGGCGA